MDKMVIPVAGGEIPAEAGFDPFRGEGAAETVSNIAGSVFLTTSSGVEVRIPVGHAVVVGFGRTKTEASERALVARARAQNQELY